MQGERTEISPNAATAAALLLAGFSTAVLGMLLGHVVPQFEKVFAQLGAELPLLTAGLLKLSRWPWPLLVLLLAWGLLCYFVCRRSLLHRRPLGLPLIIILLLLIVLL